MTQVLIDRALAEATLRELKLAAVTYAALGKVMLKDGAEATRDKLSAALANAEPTGWQPLVEQGKEAQELAKIMKDFADKNPKSLMLKELDK